MCSREEVKEEIMEALLKNNILRDKLWEERNSLLLGQMSNTIDNKLNHQKMTPEAKDTLFGIQRLCDVRGEQIKNMEDKIDKMDIKFDKLGSKIDTLIEKIDNRYASKDDLIFWRNILIVGIILSTFTGVLSMVLHR